MDLERELGVTLMLRGKNGLTLTDDGIFFRQRAEEIGQLADRLEQAFVRRNADVSGVISIGATEAAGSRMLAKFIREFSEKYPLVRFDLYNEMADYIKDRMDKGLIDVGLLLEPVDTSKYDFVRLSQKETWGVLMRDDHPLSERERISPGGNRAVSAHPAPAGAGARGNFALDALRGKRPEHPAELHASVQRGAAGRRGTGLRVLSGRRAGNPQQPTSALHPD